MPDELALDLGHTDQAEDLGEAEELVDLADAREAGYFVEAAHFVEEVNWQGRYQIESKPSCSIVKRYNLLMDISNSY